MSTSTDTTTDATTAGQLDDFGDAELDWGAAADEEPLACGIENPESCEACQ